MDGILIVYRLSSIVARLADHFSPGVLVIRVRPRSSASHYPKSEQSPVLARLTVLKPYATVNRGASTLGLCRARSRECLAGIPSEGLSTMATMADIAERAG